MARSVPRAFPLNFLRSSSGALGGASPSPNATPPSSSAAAAAGEPAVLHLSTLGEQGPTQVHIHLWNPGPGPMQQLLAVRRATRGVLLLPSQPPPRAGSSVASWVVPFLCGSGCTALGMVAYGSYLDSRPSHQVAAPGGVLGLRQVHAAVEAFRSPHVSLAALQPVLADRKARRVDDTTGQLVLAQTSSRLPADAPSSSSSSSSVPAWGSWGLPWRSPMPTSAQGGDLIAAPDTSHTRPGSGAPDPFPMPELSPVPHLPAPASLMDSTNSSPNSSTPLTRASITQAAARVAPSVVQLMVTDDRNASLPPGSSGSGFIYHGDGYILTNAHVVAAAQQHGKSLTVHLQDGHVLKGRLVSMDKATDVAVVKVDPPAGTALPIAPLGVSSSLQVGEWVVALGSPFSLKHSVTAGIISCVERWSSELSIKDCHTPYIQTDAAINLGNSGGPLINLDGEVIGMSVMKAATADGVSFAIPVDVLRNIMRQLGSPRGRVVRPRVGITLVEVQNGGLEQLRRQVPELPPGIRCAVAVQRVQEGSPAAAAGLQPDDILLAVGGETSLSMSKVVGVIGHHVRQPLELVVLRRRANGRGCKTLKLTLTAEEATTEQ